MSCLFSILIPTRQRHDTLQCAMQTVLAQQFDDFELVIMDNCSTDDTADVVHGFNDERIVYHRSERRLAMRDNWELGLSHTRGSYVFILGDDDGLMPDALALAGDYLASHEEPLLCWERPLYGWPNAPLGEFRDRLQIPTTRAVVELRDSATALRALYGEHFHFERTPTIYNGFVRRDIIEGVQQSFSDRYFHLCSPDLWSGLANCGASPRFALSRRFLSISGISGHSTGVSSMAPTLNQNPVKEFVAEQADDWANHIADVLQPGDGITVPRTSFISVANDMAKGREMFCATHSNSPFATAEFNVSAFLRVLLRWHVRDPNIYEELIAYTRALAARHGVKLGTLPQRPTADSLNAGGAQGFEFDGAGRLRMLHVNCAQACISDVAAAVRVAHGALPAVDRLIPGDD
jgi:hypothetical protein